MSEPHDIRLKRLKMRSMRRGIKEMDLVLSAFADRHLAAMSAADLDLYEALLDENDQDLLTWVTGQVPSPAPLAELISQISRVFQRESQGENPV